jgi:hypothetical protein
MTPSKVARGHEVKSETGKHKIGYYPVKSNKKTVVVQFGIYGLKLGVFVGS